MERVPGLFERRWLGFHQAWFWKLWLVTDTLDKGVMERTYCTLLSGTAATATLLEKEYLARVVDTIVIEMPVPLPATVVRQHPAPSA